MSVTLGPPISFDSTSITVGIDQGTLPGNFASDRFWIARDGMRTEPARAADVTLSTGGNTSVVFTGLQPDSWYWVCSYRHFTDATAPERAGQTGAPSTAAQGGVWWEGWYRTKATGADYGLSAVPTTWVEDWSDLSNWFFEFGLYNKHGHVTVPDPDGSLGGTRKLISDYPWTDGSYAAVSPVFHSKKGWREDRPLQLTVKIRYNPANAIAVLGRENMGSIGFATGEDGYATMGVWSNQGSYTGWTFWGDSDVGKDVPYPANIQTTDPGDVWPTPQTLNIRHDGAGNWSFYIDGANTGFTHVWHPGGPLHIWNVFDKYTESGPITVVGTPYGYFAGDVPHFWNWEGNNSVRESSELKQFWGGWIYGTFGERHGGLSAPTQQGWRQSEGCWKLYSHPTSDAGAGYATTSYAAGAWNGKSPRLWNIKNLRFAGRQTNGSMTVTVRRVGTNAVLAGPYTPTGSTSNVIDMTGIDTSSAPVWIDVQGNHTVAGSDDASVLHYLVTELLDSIPGGQLTLDPDSVWSLSGSVVTVSHAPIGVRSAVRASVVSTGGGVLRFAGADAGRFTVSTDGGATYAPTATIGSGTTVVRLAVTPQTGDTTLAATLGVPV